MPSLHVLSIGGRVLSLHFHSIGSGVPLLHFVSVDSGVPSCTLSQHRWWRAFVALSQRRQCLWIR